MQMSFEQEVVDSECMSDQSSTARSIPKKILIGRRPRGPNSNLSGTTRPTAHATRPPPDPPAQQGPTSHISATPLRGPSRFIVLNRDGQGLHNVARRTREVMENMVRNIPQPTSDMGKENAEKGPLARSPARVGSVLQSRNLNRLTEEFEFSPSPVKRVVVERDRVLDSPANTSINTDIAGVGQEGLDRVTSTLVRPVSVTARREVTEVQTENRAIHDPPALASVQEEAQPILNDMRPNLGPEDVSPDLGPGATRPSDAFQPTPSFSSKRRKKRAGSGRKGRKRGAEIEEPQSDGCELGDTEASPVEVQTDSDADLGFGLPPRKKLASVKSHSDSPEVTLPNFKKPVALTNARFKKPSSVSVAKTLSEAPVKTVSSAPAHSQPVVPAPPAQPAESEPLEGGCRYLQSWRPTLRKGKLYLEGNLLDLNSTDLGYSDQLWVTSRISRRLGDRKVATKGGTEYILEGELVLGSQANDVTSRGKTANFHEDGPIPQFIIDRFLQGFPENWEKLVQQWVRFNERRQQDLTKSCTYNSTTLSNLTNHHPASLTQLGGNLSAISAVNHSQFLDPNSRVRVLTLSRTSNTTVSIMGGEEGPNFQVVGTTDRSRSPLNRVPPSVKSNVSNSRTKNGATSNRPQARTKSPPLEQIMEDDLVSAEPTEVGHRCRSPSVRQNINRDKTGARSVDQTMSHHDFALLRAKSYNNTTVVDKRKNYMCPFCEFLSPLFNSLKLHLRDNHLEKPSETRPVRSQSNETVLASPGTAEGRKKSRRSSFSPSKQPAVSSPVLASPGTAEGRKKSRRSSFSPSKQPVVSSPDPLQDMTVSGNNFHCKACKFTTKVVQRAKQHLKTKKHLEGSKVHVRVPEESNVRQTDLSGKGTRASILGRQSGDEDRDIGKKSVIGKKGEEDGRRIDSGTQSATSRQRSYSGTQTSESRKRSQSGEQDNGLRDDGTNQATELASDIESDVPAEKNREKSKSPVGSRSVRNKSNKPNRSEMVNGSSNTVGSTKRDLKDGHLKVHARHISSPQTSQSTGKRTPGLGLFNCFACDYVTNTQAVFTSHLSSSKHRKQAKEQRKSVKDKASRVRFIHCDPCQFNSDVEIKFLEHVSSKKHDKNFSAAVDDLTKGSTAVSQVTQDGSKQSRFGRKLKKTKALTRGSCVYDTPEGVDSLDEVEPQTARNVGDARMIEADVPGVKNGDTGKRRGRVEQIAKESSDPSKKSKPTSKDSEGVKQSKSERTKKKNEALKKSKPVQADVREIDNESLRRTVLDPFKRSSTVSVVREDDSAKKALAAVSKLTVNPKTIKDRQNNAEALKEYNKDHEDDLFGDPSSKQSKATLLKGSTKTLLNHSDTDSENEVSVHSARTPISAYMKRGESEKTPKILEPNSPLVYNPAGYQYQAYIHKKVADNAKDARQAKKHRLKSAMVSRVTSRAQMDAQVDQSSRLIRDMTQETPGKSQEDGEEEETEDWFNHSGEDITPKRKRGSAVGLLDL